MSRCILRCADLPTSRPFVQGWRTERLMSLPQTTPRMQPMRRTYPSKSAPRGIIGLETAAAVVNTAVGLDPVTFFQRMSVSPAHLARLPEQGRWAEPGGRANLVVFDPSVAWTPDVWASRAENSPFTGRQLRGRVVATMYGGRLTFRDGKVQG